MPYLDVIVEEEEVAPLPPEEAPPPAEGAVTLADYGAAPAPPVEPVPPPAAEPVPVAEGPVTLNDYAESALAEAPPAEPAPGPFASAVQGIQSGLGGAVAPIVDALPEPVQNLADIVGQPVGGALDAVTGVTTELGQGDLPGAALAALEPVMAPQQRAREQAGTRVAEGLPVAPHDEFIGDPGSALAILPSLSLGTGLAAGGGASIDDWARANPQTVQDAYAAGGGNAVVDAYLTSLDASPIPPPQLVNPLDAGAIDAGPLERGANILGEIPDFLGGYGTAAREGALGPFLKNQLIETAMDPLLLAGPITGPASRGIGRAARAGVQRLPGGETFFDLSSSEQARRRAEEIGTAGGEYIPALRATDTSGAAPAAGVTPGAAIPTPPPNGRLAATPDLGQPLAAAPPIPPPDPFGFPRYEHVPLAPGAPMRPRSPETGRPVIAPGSRPEIEGPLRAQLDGMGLPDVGIRLVNDLRDAAPNARPSEGARYLPDQNAIALSLDATRASDWPALIEREAQKAVRDQVQRQTVQAAYGAASLAGRRAVAEVPNPNITRLGVVLSEPAVRDMAQGADGLFRFADGYRPRGPLDAEGVLRQTLDDVEFWATADDITNRRWLDLDKRLNPDGTVDREAMRGPVGDAATREARDRHAFAVFEDALQRALPRNAPKSRLGRINQQYLGTVRRLMLFNPLRIPSYTLQNLITNSINLGARIGPRAVIDLFSKPSEMARVFRNARSLGEGKPTYHTHFGSLQAKMKAGTKPNIPMSHAAYFDRLGGKSPKWLETAQRALAPNTTRYIGTMADQLPREVAATRTIYREYRKLNREMPARIRKALYDRGVRVPEAKIYQVWRDFADAERTVTDLNTGAPYRTMLGREAKHEPVWAADDLGASLKAHLTEDMRHKPDTGDLNRAIDRITRDSKNHVRGILDAADTAADDALFPWRNTNADEMAGKLFLYHFWTSRQGGLYVTEGLKRPYLISAYGRMMDEFEQQAEELEQPPWMKGFFQVQNSIAGYSTWFSPFDLVQSLLTFADWQYGEDDNAKYKDLTELGKKAGMAPFLIHPALQMAAYSLGLLGPDYYAPPLTGAETYGAGAINLLNLANAQGILPAWVNAMGIGVDDAGNKVPITPRPLQELYSRVGNAISTAFAPITGLSPVEVYNFGASQERNVASTVDSEYRRAHPELVELGTEGEMQIQQAVTEILADHGSPEYQAALRKSADMPYHLMEGLPGVVQGAARIASPVRIYNWPEQYNVDRWNIESSGYTPERNIPHLGEIDPATGELTPAGERAKFVENAARYGVTSTPEARQLANMQNEYYALEPLDFADADNLAGKLYAIHEGTSDETVTIGGQEYTPDMIRGMERGDLYDLGTQALADVGYSRDDQQGFKDAQARYLADNPELAGYFEYKDLARNHPDGEQGFVTETAMQNPGFAQFVRSSLMDHTTGEIDYGAATYVDAYLASQGTRPSVYSPLVGNEPSTIPGGYPALAGATPGQPLLPQMTGTEPFPLYSKPVDPDSYFANESLIAWIDPQLAGSMQTVANPDQYSKGMAQVRVGDQVGYVDAAYLVNASPPQPTGMPGRAPAPVQPTGGLAGLAGGVTSALGAGKDALGAVVGSMFGGGTTPTKPADTSAGFAPGSYDVVPANDGIGVQSTIASDRTWMEEMVGDHNATVTTDYKGPPTANMAYQDGHGAATNNHAAYDISCDTGYAADGSSTCPGTPIKAPLAGRVVCAGFGQGTGEAMGSPNCTYSKNTTYPGSAHDVVLDVGTDANGNALQLSFSHMGTSDVTPGQQVNVGDLLGGMGDTDGGPHIHLEAWGWCSAENTYHLLDPQLVVVGYYAENSVC